MTKSFAVVDAGSQYGGVASALNDQGAISIGVVDVDFLPDARSLGIHRPART